MTQYVNFYNHCREPGNPQNPDFFTLNKGSIMTKNEASRKLSKLCAVSLDMGKILEITKKLNEDVHTESDEIILKKLWIDRSQKQDKLYKELLKELTKK